MNVIETAGLGKRYGRTWALKDAALAIPAGYVVALVGPNGASPPITTRSGPAISRRAGTGTSSSSRAAGCSPCR
jgi:ABC-2 type transport system ATP-binding protein